MRSIKPSAFRALFKKRGAVNLPFPKTASNWQRLESYNSDTFGEMNMKKNHITTQPMH